MLIFNEAIKKKNHWFEVSTKIRMTPKEKQSCFGLGKIYFLRLNHLLIPNLKQTRKKYIFFSYLFLHFIDVRDQIQS